MGNVAYPVKPEDLDLGLPSGTSAVFFVPMGAVNIHPSREALRMTPKTKATLGELADDFNIGREKAAQAKIAGAKTLFDAIEVFKTFKGKIFDSNSHNTFKTFKGKEIPAKLEFPEGTVATASHLSGWNKKSDHWYVDGLKLLDWPQAIIVKNWSQTRFTAATKKKLVKWIGENGFAVNSLNQISNFYLIPANFDIPLFDPKHVVDWEVIRAIKLDYKRHNNPKAAGTYDTYVYSDNDGEDGWNFGMATEDFPDYPMYYVTYDKENARRSVEVQIMKAHHDEFILVTATSNRIEKFKRLYPDANQVTDECSNLAKAFAKTVDPLDVEANEAQGYSDILKLQSLGQWLHDHPHARILDPNIDNYIQIATRDLKHFKSSATLYGHYLHSSDMCGKGGIEYRDILNDYPLVNSCYALHRMAEDGIEYMNAMYRRRIVDHCSDWN
jgi:hypothetical protein